MMSVEIYVQKESDTSYNMGRVIEVILNPEHQKEQMLILKTLDETIIYIPYEEITVEYYYGVKDGSFYMNKQLETAVKKEAKFKWINMENDGMIRKIKYKYRKVALTARNLNNDM